MNRDEQEKQLIQDFKESFDSDGGKRVLAKLVSLSTFYRSSISSDRNKVIDTNRLIYDEGQRAVLIYIHNQLNKDIGKPKQKGVKNDRGS